MGGLLRGNKLNVVARRAHYTRTGQPANDLTLTYTLFDETGTPVTGAQDIDMPLETETGDYVGPLAASITATLTLFGRYRLVERDDAKGVIRQRWFTAVDEE